MSAGIGAALERLQAPLALAAVALAAAAGIAAPIAPVAEAAIGPALAALLFVTFLGVPVRAVARAFRDTRFLAAVAILNLVVGPAIASAVVLWLPLDPGVAVGLLLVLLAPCIDYVISFARLAGAAADRLVAAAPLLMIGQLLLVPPAVLLLAGPAAADAIRVEPFAEALALFVALPLAAAWLVQGLGRRLPVARTIERAAPAWMVPLLLVTLVAVVAATIADAAARIADVAVVVPVALGFAAVLVGAGAAVGRALRLPPRVAMAATFSGVTRNGLVVLPLALAMPPALALAPLAVVTQVLVELVVMVALVRIAPRLHADPPAAPPR